jgi:hypothetical protein
VNGMDKLDVDFTAFKSNYDNCSCDCCHGLSKVIKLRIPETKYHEGILKERKKRMEKLKVCALCGKPAIIEKWSSGGMMYMAKCSNPKCQVGEEITCTKGHDLKRVIEEWNLIQERAKS